MNTLPAPAGIRLLAAAVITALCGVSPVSFARPPLHSLAFAATLQDEGDEGEADDEEEPAEDEAADDVDEDQADEAQAEEEQAEEEQADDEEVADAPVAEDEPQDEAAVPRDEQSDDGAGAQSDDTDAQSAEADGAADEGTVEDADAAEPGDDFADDGWAGAWVIDDGNEADDAVPVDHSVFGNDEVWQVVEENDYSQADGDSPGGGMPSIRTSKRTPGKPGRKPPRQPGDDEDTVYSFGGLPVAAQSVPWQAQILYPAAPPRPNDKRPAWQRQHYCGGALIAPDWVVTAAHCIDQNEVDQGFKVRLGAQDISKGDGVLYRIDRIVRHSQYNNESNDVNHPPNMYANDIALVHIVADGTPVPIDSRRIRQIPLNQKALPPAIPVSATGWGVTGSSEAANTMNAVLLRVDLQAMPNPVCQQRPGYGAQKIKDGVFCASNPARSTCRGDSGGPVILTNGTPLLVGIVSWGKKACAGDGRPGVYTRIDRYTQWISDAMKLPPGKNRLP